MTLILLCLLFQAQVESKDNEKIFTPIPTGNVINVGSFNVTVPEGLFYAADEDAANMFRLAKAEHIPNCAGIFFSNSNSWTFCGVVQHFPYQPFSLDPQYPPDYFESLFKTRHLYNMSEITGSAEVIHLPTFDEANQTFTMGMHYQDTADNTGVFFKKAFITGQDAVLVIIRVDSFSEFQSYENVILSMLDAVTLNPNIQAEALPSTPFSYLKLFGLSPNRQTQSADTQLSPAVIAVSALLGVLGIVLLVFAMKMHKKNAPKDDSEDSDDSDDSDEDSTSNKEGS